MRDKSVSLAKGIAIALVVLIHSIPPGFTAGFFGMFAVSSFFFMSGYCFKDNYLDDAYKFLKKRLTGIYWPYLKWSLLFLLLHNMFYHLNIYSDEYGYGGKISILYTSADFVKRAISVTTQMQGHEQLLGAYWFMKLLFIGSFIFYIALKVLKRNAWGTLLLLAISVLLSLFDWELYYFHIGTRELYAAFFIYVGYLYKKHQLDFHQRPWIWCLAVILVVSGTQLWFTTMHNYDYWKIFPHAFTAILAILTLLCFSQWLSRKAENKSVKCIVFIGDHTMEVLTWHFLSMKLVSLMLIAIYDLPIKRLSEFPVIEEYARQGWWIAYLIVGVAIPVVWTYYYHLFKDRLTKCSSDKTLTR